MEKPSTYKLQTGYAKVNALLKRPDGQLKATITELRSRAFPTGELPCEELSLRTDGAGVWQVYFMQGPIIQGICYLDVGEGFPPRVACASEYHADNS